MAETKNNFTGAKMNKDIDDRLIPENEYRNAINLEISKSENADVGSLQTVLGNEIVINFNTLTDTPNLDCIGNFVDTANNRIFLFLTDYTDNAAIPQYSIDANNYIYVYNVLQNTTTLLVSGAFLNFSKNRPVIGVNLLEDLLFWTDNRNQPRKISVSNALNSSTYYTTEEQISVAKLSPTHAIELYAESTTAPTTIPPTYETTMYDVVSEFLPPGGVEATVSGTVVGSFVFAIDPIPLGYPLPVVNQIVSGPGIPPNVLVTDYNIVTNVVSVTAEISLADGVLVKFNANPYYNANYIGDPSFLEDKFVRFSYRYRFDENEYSIFAPFTQITYIPKQDGYFLYEENLFDPLLEPRIDDEMAALRSTVVSFMYNKVNNIKLIIPLPCPANELQDKYKIAEIEILYKESDGLAVQVVDVITVSKIAEQGGINEFYVYDYQAKKPFKTLPDRDLIRVYDRTPVIALGQEIISNRVVYSNYKDKQSYPKFLNYNVACTDKSPFSISNNRTSIIEYPNHSVKQNRNYQIGVVLSDRFGRQSGVILSNAITSPNDLFGASSLYVPYRKSDPENPEEPDGVLVNKWPGYSLKVLFNNPIDGGGTQGWPGLYNGDPMDPNYNPLGWYSYKIVVKQTEQDYYNVYAPGVMAAYPESITQELGKTSHVVLMSDNINKVPRDLNDVSNSQEQYRSSVKLYPRVNNVDPAIKPWTNQQYYPGNTFAFVNTIATNSSLFSPIPPLPTPYDQFYQVDSNPLIARLATDYKIGVTSDLDVINLAILETNPGTSRLDIYWEAATTGIISELNQAIISGSNGPDSLVDWDFNLTEAYDDGQLVVEDFYFADIFGAIITTIDLGDISLNITNSIYESRNSKFVLENGSSPGKFNLRTVGWFYFGFNAAVLESYRFNFTVSAGTPPNTVTVTITEYGSLQNITPTITNAPTEILELDAGTIDIWQFEGVNGSNPLGGLSTEEITWSISPLTAGPFFTIDSNGLLQQPSLDVPSGIYELIIVATDAGGLFTESSIFFTYGATGGYVITVLSGGPFVTQTQGAGTWAAAGYLEVLPGYEVYVQAASLPFGVGANSVNTTIIFDAYPSNPLIKNATTGNGGLSTAGQLLVGGPYQYYFSMDATFGGSGGTSQMAITTI